MTTHESIIGHIQFNEILAGKQKAAILPYNPEAHFKERETITLWELEDLNHVLYVGPDNQYPPKTGRSLSCLITAVTYDDTLLLKGKAMISLHGCFLILPAKEGV